jgi:hypothetical protein
VSEASLGYTVTVPKGKKKLKVVLNLLSTTSAYKKKCRFQMGIVNVVSDIYSRGFLLRYF